MTMDLFGDVAVTDSGLREDLDFYETPSWMTRSLLHFMREIRGGTRILECCSGRDAIANVMRRERGCQVLTNDVDPRHPAMTLCDATEASYWRDHAPRSIEWVVTNPPFNVAQQILEHAIQHAEVGVAFLLRKTFLEPTEDRGPWLQEHPPTMIIGQPRYSFRGKGNDSVSCDWMIWQRNPPAESPIIIDYVADARKELA